MPLGERLKEARKKRGLTQVEAAKTLGIANTALSNYERGERDPDTLLLKRISELYEVSTDYLLGRSREKEIDLLEILKDKDIRVTAGRRRLSYEERETVLNNINNLPQGDENQAEIRPVSTTLNKDPSGLDLCYNDMDIKLENAIIAASHQGRQVIKNVPQGLRELIKHEIISILEERKERDNNK